jgi:hypothetical protein
MMVAHIQAVWMRGCLASCRSKRSSTVLVTSAISDAIKSYLGMAVTFAIRSQLKPVLCGKPATSPSLDSQILGGTL